MMRLNLHNSLLLILTILIMLVQISAFLISSVQAALDYERDKIPVQVECLYPEIPPGMPEPIKVTIGTTENPPVEGKALLFVIQPNEAVNRFEIKDLLKKVGCRKEQMEKILGKIGYESMNVTGYLLISAPDGNKYVNTFTYPDDFVSITGSLSTEHPGKYKVVLIYWGLEIDCLSITIKYGFRCGHFHVIPEALFGTISAVLVFFSSLFLKKRLKHA